MRLQYTSFPNLKKIMSPVCGDAPCRQVVASLRCRRSCVDSIDPLLIEPIDTIKLSRHTITPTTKRYGIKSLKLKLDAETSLSAFLSVFTCGFLNFGREAGISSLNPTCKCRFVDDLAGVTLSLLESMSSVLSVPASDNGCGVAFYCVSFYS